MNDANENPPPAEPDKFSLLEHNLSNFAATAATVMEIFNTMAGGGVTTEAELKVFVKQAADGLRALRSRCGETIETLNQFDKGT